MAAVAPAGRAGGASAGPPASVRLLRGFAVDFLTAHDLDACRRIMADDYALSIGGHTLAGREAAYLPATAAQLDQFPGLVVTVHDVVAGIDAVAMRFTEHGASVKDGGRVAAWGGVTLFQLEAGRLRRGWAEEDYFARKRQLKTGAPDTVRPPGLAPWDAPYLEPDAATEAAVRRWASDLGVPEDAGWEEISREGPQLAELVQLESLEIDALFTAGPRAAAHLVGRGRYLGGFPDIDAAYVGAGVTVCLAALFDVEAEHVNRAQAAVDRLGLHRTLLDLARVAAPKPPEAP